MEDSSSMSEAFGGVGSTGSSSSTSSSSSSSSSSSPVTTKRRKRRWLRALVALVVIIALLVGGGYLYLYWQWSRGKTLNIPKGTLDPKIDETKPRLPVVTIPIPNVGVPSVGPDPTGDGTDIPEPGTPNTVPGLPGPNVPEVEDTTPLPPLDVEGLDPSLPPLNTLPVDQLKIGPLIDTSAITAVGGRNSLNFLIIGSDSRAGVPKGQEDSFGVVAGQRSDTIMILRVDPDAQKAWVLSIPRDLFVRMPGTNDFDRINAASARSDGLLVKTVQENLDIPIQHMMKVDFVGFQKMVSAVGGVKICFARPVRDGKSGLNQPAGCNVLSGEQATGYVRSRYYEEQLPDGTWKRDGRGDLGRIERQQIFMRAGMEAAVNNGLRKPTKLHATLTKLRAAIAFDPTLGFTEVLSLADKLRSFDPNAMVSYKVPSTPFTVDKKAVLKVDVKKAPAIVGQFGHHSAVGGARS